MGYRSERVEEIRQTSDALIRRSGEALSNMRETVERTRTLIARVREAQAVPEVERRRNAEDK